MGSGAPIPARTCRGTPFSRFFVVFDRRQRQDRTRRPRTRRRPIGARPLELKAGGSNTPTQPPPHTSVSSSASGYECRLLELSYTKEVWLQRRLPPAHPRRLSHFTSREGGEQKPPPPALSPAETHGGYHSARRGRGPSIWVRPWRWPADSASVLCGAGGQGKVVRETSSAGP